MLAHRFVGRIARVHTARIVVCRALTSSSPVGTDDRDGAPEKQREILLFERTPGDIRLLSSGIVVSTICTTYWTWYLYDFVPAVNAAGQITLNPMVGTGGLLFALAMQAAIYGYAKTLVSSLTLRPGSLELVATFHKLFPPGRPATKQYTLPVGDLRLDPESNEAKLICMPKTDDKRACNGNMQNFRGMIGLKPRMHGWMIKLPWLLQIRRTEDVLQPSLLLEVLMDPPTERKGKSSIMPAQFRDLDEALANARPRKRVQRPAMRASGRPRKGR
jgi:hypothetical protein